MTTSADAAPRRVGEVVTAAAAWLERRGIENPRLLCELLASRLLRLPRLQLHVEYARRFSDAELDAMRRGLVRLGRGEPVQYVLGEWDFRGHLLKVDRRVLVPRPETEQLVQLVLDAADLWHAGTTVADVGTGSGCIAISLAIERPEGRYTAIDTSAEALEVAATNVASHGVQDRVRLLQGEGCGGLAPNELDAVVSNPPYIPTQVIAGLPRNVRDFEPHQALDGGVDGLAVLRMVAHDAAMSLRRGGRVFLEIGESQGTAVHDLLEHVGFEEISILEDLTGRVRFAAGRIP